MLRRLPPPPRLRPVRRPPPSRWRPSCARTARWAATSLVPAVPDSSTSSATDASSEEALMTAAALPEIEVVAAVLRDREGRVLIAERPAGKPLAGFWEFPGGKLEPGEPAFDALQRELHEELGIRVRHAYRLQRFTHRYPEREVELDVWRVTAWEGTPASQEGQRLEWVSP